MPGGQEQSPRLGTDASRSALDFVHGLLCQSQAQADGLTGLLTNLAAAFAASGAGIADLSSGKVLVRHPTGDERAPWSEDAQLMHRVQQSPTALSIPRQAGGSLLLTVVRPRAHSGWVFWLEADAQRCAWSAAEAAALTLAGQALGRILETPEPSSGWVEQLDQAERQKDLETAARVAARLAHDFGNVLTGVIGFCDLSLAIKAPAESQLSRYLRELQRCAQNGAELTHLLRLFCRRQAGGVQPCETANVVAEEAARLATPGGFFTVSTTLGDGLPRAAIDAGQLRQVLAALLENARDAMKGAGAVSVSTRAVDLSADDCLNLYGDARPGSYVEIAVANSGPGLGADVSKRLFTELFFTNKPRHRGFGLAVAYGILHAHHGGLRLRPAASGGTVAEIYLPVASLAPAVVAVAQQTGKGGRILVVDDDANILRMICVTLERAGYRVEGAANAEEAFSCYATADHDRFDLVLSDLAMPQVSGVDLARRLLSRDNHVRVLFMSGQATGELARPDIAAKGFELLSKPFRPDGLLRAVRGAIDRKPHGLPISDAAGAARPSLSL
jgi:signal transduction histidine kinase/ActR/RegA family two-component response regulator